jgi:dihydrofolate reductase
VTVSGIAFVGVDGVYPDPSRADATAFDARAFSHGPEPRDAANRQVAEALGDNGVLLLGRRTWEALGKLWRQRGDAFAAYIDKVPKLVATRDGVDTAAWPNSAPLKGGLAEAVRRQPRDVAITGSLDVVWQLMSADLVDEYRLVTVPDVAGGVGRRLFPDGRGLELESLGAERAGAATVTRFRRVR